MNGRYYEKIKKYIPYAVIVVCFVMLFVRAFYSFCWSDETFYFSTADRFYKGDGIFVHDWFPTQLSGVFILPFYSLFLKITGSTAGVILFFRIVYVIWELVLGIIIYRLMKDIRGDITALCIALFSMFFTHLNIATISYYTMSVTFFELAMVLVYAFYNRGDNECNLIFAGICFAISVLNLPTMAVAYVLIVIFGAILCVSAKIIKPKNTAILDSLNLPCVFKYTLLGIIIPAVMFAIYLLATVSIPEFIKAIPYVLTDDEHITSKLYPIRKMYLGIIESYGSKIFYFGCLIAVLSIISWLISIAKDNFDNLRNNETIAGLLSALNSIIVIMDAVAFILYAYKSFGYTGYIQTAIMMFALPLFFISKKKDIFAFILFFMSGITFALVFSYSSNGMLYILAMGYFTSSIGGIIFIDDFLSGFTEKLRQDKTDDNTKTICKKATIACTTVFIAFSLVHTGYCRIANVYRDSRLQSLTSVITYGPAKGLRTTEKHKEMYDEVYSVINEYCQSQSDETSYILFSKLLPWGYICTDKRAGAPTTWRNGMDNERLGDYYGLHPERFPDTILVVDEHYGTYDDCGDVEYDPSPNENASEGYMYDQIAKYGYEEIDVRCGKLYRKPD